MIMADLNSVTDYLKLDKKWINTLKGLFDEIQNEGKTVVLVALSRKMSTIINVLCKAYPEDAAFLENYPFITEHVLPYFLKEFDKEKHRIVIVDDAIYYGSTISQISSYIYKLTAVKPYVVSVARSEMVGDLPYAEMLSGRSDDDAVKEPYNDIKEKNFTFFTTQNAKRIINLRQPIDMEFPILRFEIAKGYSLKEKLGDKLHYFFEKDAYVYPITHQIKKGDNGEWEDVTNYNVLPKENSLYDHWNKDFSKLRFFISDMDVIVVAYAPGILSEDMLNSEKPLFSDSHIQEMWEKVRNYEMKEWPDEEGEDLITRRIKNSYEMQCCRSLVIWANYLASYLYMLRQKEALNKTISEVFGDDVLNTAKFFEKDTRQLLPPQLVESLTASLNNYYQGYKSKVERFYGLNSAVLASQEQVSEEYRADYWSRTREGLLKCSMAKEALSVIFSNMLVVINDGKLKDDALRRTNRLRFGITYTALKDILSFPLGEKDLWYNIHVWMDKNIDEATVKPYYERLLIDGSAYWVRMFRAGENENSFTKMRRICEFIIWGIRQKEKGEYVERSMVEDLLTLAWEDPCGVIKHTYKWDFFKKGQEGSAFCLYYKDVNEYGNKDVDEVDSVKGKDDEDREPCKKFLDFLISQNSLKVLQDPSGIVWLSTIEDGRMITPLELKQELALLDYVDTYYYYKKTNQQHYIMNNFFPKVKGEMKGYTEELFNWRNDFIKKMNDAISVDNSEDMVSDYTNDLSEKLNRIIQETIKSTNITNDDLENENRREIRKFLQKEDSEYYMDFKNKTRTAVVIKGMYNQLFSSTMADRETIEQKVDYYLGFIEGEDNEKKVVMEFVKMDDADRIKPENREKVVEALKKILQDKIA